MKSKCFFSAIIVLFCSTICQNLNAQSPDWIWAKSTGLTVVTDGIGAEAMALDASGNVYITGAINGTVDFDPGPGVYNVSCATWFSDTYILKLDSAGNFVWVKMFHGTDYSTAFGIVLDANGNIYTTGKFNGTIDFNPDSLINFNVTTAGTYDIFVSKLDSAGNFIWAKKMGGPGNYNDSGLSIALDASGNVYTTGWFMGTGDFDPDTSTIYNLISSGGEDVFVSKLDNSGNFVWAKKWGGVNYDESYSISVDASGFVYTTGDYGSTVDFDPGPGVYNLTTTTSSVFISKLDSSGNFVWAKAMTGGTSSGNSMHLDANNNICSTGLFSGTVDFNPGSGTFNLATSGSFDIFISKLDSSGNFIWAKKAGGTGYDLGTSITTDDAGNVYTSGGFSSTADFDPSTGIYNLTSASATGFNIFVLKLNSQGNFVWAKATGGTIIDEGISIVLDDFGNLYSTGRFASPSVTFDSTILTNPVIVITSNAYIAKLGTSITGIESLINTSGLFIYPNPFNDKLSISMTDTDISDIIIYDVSSRKLFQQKFANSVSLNTEQLAKGIYLYEVKNKNGLIKNGKVVKY